MPFLLFVIFLVVPLIEIALFVLIGGRIGIFPTLATCVLTALLGAVLVRQQGLATLSRLQHQVERGELPAMAMAEGLAILASGLLLLTPGFFTDAIGFTLLFPPARRGLLKLIWHHISGMIHISGMPPGSRPAPGGPPRDADGNIIIDADAEEVFEAWEDAEEPDDDTSADRHSRWGRRG